MTLDIFFWVIAVVIICGLWAHELYGRLHRTRQQQRIRIRTRLKK